MSVPNQEERLLTVEEVAARLRVTPVTVRRWLRDHKLPSIRLPGAKAGWRVRESDLQAFLRQFEQ